MDIFNRKKNQDEEQIIRSTKITSHLAGKDEDEGNIRNKSRNDDKDKDHLAAITIVNYYLRASDCELLQLVKLPKSMAFDLAYDVMQSSILDEERINKRITLKSVFREAWLMIMRGAEGKFAESVYSTGHTQVEAELSKPSDFETHER